MDASSDSAKDNSVRVIGMTATMMKADFIFQVHEAWKLPQKYILRYEEIMEKYDGGPLH